MLQSPRKLLYISIVLFTPYSKTYAHVTELMSIVETKDLGTPKYFIGFPMSP